jgi:hypothetical protein
MVDDLNRVVVLVAGGVRIAGGRVDRDDELRAPQRVASSSSSAGTSQRIQKS